MANSQVFAPTRRVKSQTDVSRRFHADRATVVLPPFELSTGELPPVRQSRLLGGSRFRKTVNCKGLRKKARSPTRWAPGSGRVLKRVKTAPDCSTAPARQCLAWCDARNLGRFSLRFKRVQSGSARGSVGRGQAPRNRIFPALNRQPSGIAVD